MGPFADATGREATLNPSERAALGLIGSGVAMNAIHSYLDEWFDSSRGVVSGLRRKLDPPGGHLLGEQLLILARQKSLLLSESPPNLNGVRPERQQRLVDLATLLGTGRPRPEIASALHLKEKGLYGFIEDVIDELGYAHAKRPGQLLTMLGIGAELTPGDMEDTTDLHTLIPALTEEQKERLFPPAQTKSLEWWPFTGDRSHISIRFTGQPYDAETPNVHVGSIDQIKIAGAEIEVNNIGLSSRELAAFVFRSVGMSIPDVTANTAKRIDTKGDPQQLYNAYSFLLPSAEKCRTLRTVAPAIHAAFERGLYTTLRGSSFHDLDPVVKHDVTYAVDSITRNEKLTDTAKRLGLSLTTLMKRFRVVRQQLGLEVDPDCASQEKNVAVCLIVEVDRNFNKAAA